MPANAPVTRQIDRLLRDPRWHTNPLEVGWAIITRYRRLGIATEVGRAALAMARDELTASRVISFTERHNIASRGVMEKLDMNFVGEIHARGLVEGQTEEANDAPFAVYATLVR